MGEFPEEPAAGDRPPLFERVYGELRRLAQRRLEEGLGGTSLQATAVVHEVWLKLAEAPELEGKDSSHYYATAAQAMRWILVDRARRRRSTALASGVEDGLAAADASGDAEEVLALDAALARLETAFPRKAAVVSHRYFAGLSVEATAEALGISTATVKREWAFARAWLLRELGGTLPAPPEGDAPESGDS
ncbi:MAG: ECF-type sigma factor [Planctomycetota bacterium]